MGFDDLFEQKHNQHRHYNQPFHPGDYRNSHRGHSSYNGQSDRMRWMMILKKIRDNRKLRLFVAATCVLLLAITTGLILLLFPLLVQLYEYISENGLQGIMTAINDLIAKIWSGSK